MARLRILLVDDQQLILLGLERMLRRMRNVWEVVVADSGHKALDLLEVQPFDVLVTDLNMPGCSGIEVLEWSRKHQPSMVRIVLSAHQDPAMIHAATRTAHRFLAKPTEPAILLATLEQVSELRRLPAGEVDLRPAIGGQGRLPSSPVACHRLAVLLSDPDAPPTALRELALEDPGLAAKALHLVNSAFNGAPRPLADPGEAVLLLGPEEREDLADRPAPPEAEVLLKPIRTAHLDIARRAEAILRAEGAPPEAQALGRAAGLLSAAGPMLLALNHPGQGGEDPVRVFGVDPWEVSRQFLNLAGAPSRLLDVVAHTAVPGRARLADPLVLAAVHVASGLHDEAFLAAAGFLPRLPLWRRLQLSHEDAP